MDSTLCRIDRVSVAVLGCCFATQFFKSYSRASGAPNQIGENREAGETPARSRHCDALDAPGYQATDPRSGRLPAAKMRESTLTRVCETKSGDLPEAFASQLLSARESEARGSTSESAPARPTARKGRQELFSFARI